MELIVEDFKGRKYMVHAIPDCDENKGGYWCMVYRALGLGGNPYDYGEMEYEDEYSADFCVHPEDCNCKDEMDVEQYIQSLFHEEDTFHDLIYAETETKKPYDVACYIEKLFMDLFVLRVDGLAMNGNLDGSCTDEIYGKAHDEFMNIAFLIEGLFPDFMRDDTDDIKWYDEYHDDCVSEFCNYLMR